MKGGAGEADLRSRGAAVPALKGEIDSDIFSGITSEDMDAANKIDNRGTPQLYSGTASMTEEEPMTKEEPMTRRGKVRAGVSGVSKSAAEVASKIRTRFKGARDDASAAEKDAARTRKLAGRMGEKVASLSFPASVKTKLSRQSSADPEIQVQDTGALDEAAEEMDENSRRTVMFLLQKSDGRDRKHLESIKGKIAKRAEQRNKREKSMKELEKELDRAESVIALGPPPRK